MVKYAETCFGIEPTLFEDEYLDGDVSFAEFQRRNVRWMQDHFQELIDTLWDTLENGL